jgi:hypothetical protein
VTAVVAADAALCRRRARPFGRARPTWKAGLWPSRDIAAAIIVAHPHRGHRHARPYPRPTHRPCTLIQPELETAATNLSRPCCCGTRSNQPPLSPLRIFDDSIPQSSGALNVEYALVRTSRRSGHEKRDHHGNDPLCSIYPFVEIVGVEPVAIPGGPVGYGKRFPSGGVRGFYHEGETSPGGDEMTAKKHANTPRNRRPTVPARSTGTRIADASSVRCLWDPGLTGAGSDQR